VCDLGRPASPLAGLWRGARLIGVPSGWARSSRTPSRTPADLADPSTPATPLLTSGARTVEQRRPIIPGGRDRGRRPRSNRFVEPNQPDLQNRQAHVAHALVGSTPAPLRPKKPAKEAFAAVRVGFQVAIQPAGLGNRQGRDLAALVVRLGTRFGDCRGAWLGGSPGLLSWSEDAEQTPEASELADRDHGGRSEGARIRAGTAPAIRVPRQAEEFERHAALDPTTLKPATDLGYLLHENPFEAESYDVPSAIELKRRRFAWPPDRRSRFATHTA
jgi:hypothetical protein